MIPYKQGVLTYFVWADPPEYRVHWSPDGNDLGAPANLIYRSGTVGISAMTPWAGGVLTAFVHPEEKHVVCISSDPVANPPTPLDSPNFRYGPPSPNSANLGVGGMVPHTVGGVAGVLTIFN
jgi:hypothetical protein